MKNSVLLFLALFLGGSPLWAQQSPPLSDASKPALIEEKKLDPATEKLRKALEQLQIERDTLQAQNAIADAKLAAELADRKAAMERQKVELDEAASKLNETKEIARLKAELERAQLEQQISKAEADHQSDLLRKSSEEYKNTLSMLSMQIEEKEKEKQRDDYADQKPVYLEEPLQGKTLIISDRRIALNDVITMSLADSITERINYFNNKSNEYPIFIVIDDCPGGSVMAGYKILKAMQSSHAPVHVVIKSYAASMAAVIATCATRSYAYPNAVILHHQLRSFFAGNLTQQREDLSETEEWWKRLAGPVAQKMGLSLDDFVTRMYKQRSTGDWNEFADEAQKLKWVDVIVDEIRESSLLRNPDAVPQPAAPAIILPKLEEAAHGQMDLQPAQDQGRPICILPRLNPFDHWWLYNPDGFYRLP